MICPRCGCFFCDDGADRIILGDSRKRYCSRLCAKRAGRNPWTRLTAAASAADVMAHAKSCPRKLPYLTIADAARARGRRGWTEAIMYRCLACGFIHLSSDLGARRGVEPVRST